MSVIIHLNECEPDGKGWTPTSSYAALEQGGQMCPGTEYMKDELYADEPVWVETAPDPDPMPVFVIKGKDKLALEAIRAYRRLCEHYGLRTQAREVGKAHREMREWQQRNRAAMQLPDHPHVPATPETT
jgi:hypothetical protein